MSEIPPLIKPSQVARACGMSRRKAKSWLRRAGILELHGKHWVVSEARLRDRLPDVYDRVFAVFVLGDPKQPEVT